MYSPSGDFIPRLLPENGFTYCTACLRLILEDNDGKDHFICPEDPDE